jgi:di/tricarboxylate transporter
MARSIINLLGQQASPFLIVKCRFDHLLYINQFYVEYGNGGFTYSIGLSIANSMGADPRAVLMAIVIGCSCAYATPVGTPANMMIFPRGYRFMDYVRVGYR